tara:strand:- start:8879 stop:9112 length:234 start_codon:yes stop_codon:yes gene_type:complete
LVLKTDRATLLVFGAFLSFDLGLPGLNLLHFFIGDFHAVCTVTQYQQAADDQGQGENYEDPSYGWHVYLPQLIPFPT